MLSNLFRSEKWGDNTRTLLKGVVTLVPLFLTARALTSIVQIMAAHMLGAAEFGIANIVLASGRMLSAPQTGFTAGLIKFTSMERNQKRQAAIVSTSLWLALFTILGFSLLFVLLTGPISSFLHVSRSLYVWGIAYAASSVVYSVASAIPQSLAQFGKRAAMEACYGVTSVVFFLLFFWWMGHGFEAFICSSIAAFLVSSLVSLFMYARQIRPVIAREYVGPLCSYFFPQVAYAATSTTAETALPLILAAYLSAASVGVFSAYRLGSLGVATIFGAVFNTVLGPLSTQPERQRGAWRKFSALLAPVSLLSFIGLAAVTFVALKAMGKGYPIYLSWLLLLAGAGTLSVLFSAANTLLFARDASGFWLSNAGYAFSGVACLLGTLWAVPRYGVLGAIWAIFLSYGAGLVWLMSRGLAASRLGTVSHSPILESTPEYERI